MKKIKKTCECCGDTFELSADNFRSFEEMEEMIYCSEYCFDEAVTYKNWKPLNN
ncbi:hypothetical protein WRP3_038 [Lactococcus phage WRP3]|uniref:Uncharacterized protein n=1 Tax=Lactococcus phage WRP3 TaxID=1560313 RepID=A0A0D3MT45_9CAUD|nr:hypothetical protein ACQ37_gp038 [Lactococcus phage WRP3]AIX12541.1 hypothetical protein WRP3_038 [Lactococcus phage WRP3]